MNKEKLIKWIESEVYNNPDIGHKQAEGMIRVIKHIQSEPEEKTKFNRYTESPEKLAKLIRIMAGTFSEYSHETGDLSFSLSKEEIVNWLNEKAGE